MATDTDNVSQRPKLTASHSPVQASISSVRYRRRDSDESLSMLEAVVENVASSQLCAVVLGLRKDQSETGVNQQIHTSSIWENMHL